MNQCSQGLTDPWAVANPLGALVAKETIAI